MFALFAERTPRTPRFDKEHVIPDWLLRLHGLHSQNLTLPNGIPTMYGRHTVPCCKTCNGDLAKHLEDPIARAFTQGHSQVKAFMESGGAPLLFRWLALIFLKLLLKDKEKRWHVDRRLGSTTIGEIYNWEELHHIHCVARSLFTGARLDASVYGSLAILPACSCESIPFDFGNVPAGRSILIRSGETAVIAVLNDSGAALTALKDDLASISAPLTTLQLREVMVRMAHANIRLSPRPRYESQFLAGDYEIVAHLPKSFSLDADPGGSLFGGLLDYAVRPILEGITSDASVLDAVKDGRYTFLFDEQRAFLPSCPEGAR